MSAYETNAERISIQTDPYEVRAAQEEFYLEQTEEDLRMVLECDGATFPKSDSPVSQRESEDLLRENSDDPPVSEEQVEEGFRQI